MKVGDVVKHIESGTEMTIIRLLGDGHDEEGSGNFFKSMDRRFELQGFDFGDPTCIWFEETNMKQGVFRASDLSLVVLEKVSSETKTEVDDKNILESDDFNIDDLNLELDDLNLDDLDLDLNLDDADLNLDDLDLNLDDLDLDLGELDLGENDLDLDLDLGLDDADLELALDDAGLDDLNFEDLDFDL
jgi:hypothetical protein